MRLGLLCFFLFLLSNPLLGSSFRLISDFELRGKTYHAIIIEPPHSLSQLADGEAELADFLLDQSLKWYIQTLHSHYPNLPYDFVQSLREQNLAHRDHSTHVLVGEHSPIGFKVLASVSVIHRLDELPSEKHFGFKFPRPTPSVGSYLHFHSSPLTEAKLINSEKLQGAVYEIKQLARASDAPDFFPLLYYLLEASGTMRRIASERDSSIYPSRYLLTAHPKLQTYYRRLGFELAEFDGMPLEMDSVIMSISRDEWVSRTLRHFKSRPGAEVLSSIKIEDQSSDLVSGIRYFAKLFGYPEYLLPLCRRATRGLLFQNLPPGVQMRAIITPSDAMWLQ